MNKSIYYVLALTIMISLLNSCAMNKNSSNNELNNESRLSLSDDFELFTGIKKYCKRGKGGSMELIGKTEGEIKFSSKTKCEFIEMKDSILYVKCNDGILKFSLNHSLNKYFLFKEESSKGNYILYKKELFMIFPSQLKKVYLVVK